MKVNEELKFQILQFCSGHYLIKNIPDNWNDLTEQEQNQFINDNIWQPLEGFDSQYIWDNIENSAQSTEKFIANLLI